MFSEQLEGWPCHWGTEGALCFWEQAGRNVFVLLSWSEGSIRRSCWEFVLLHQKNLISHLIIYRFLCKIIAFYAVLSFRFAFNLHWSVPWQDNSSPCLSVFFFELTLSTINRGVATFYRCKLCLTKAFVTVGNNFARHHFSSVANLSTHRDSRFLQNRDAPLCRIYN